MLLCCFVVLVWFGLVWFGLVWFGLVWFGLVWFGLVWFGLVCCCCCCCFLNYCFFQSFERKPVPLDKYLAQLQQVRPNYNVTTIYLATDDSAIIEEVIILKDIIGRIQFSLRRLVCIFSTHDLIFSFFLFLTDWKQAKSLKGRYNFVYLIAERANGTSKSLFTDSQKEQMSDTFITFLTEVI